MERIKEFLFEWDVERVMTWLTVVGFTFMIAKLGILSIIKAFLYALIWQILFVAGLFFAGWAFYKIKQSRSRD